MSPEKGPLAVRSSILVLFENNDLTDNSRVCDERRQGACDGVHKQPAQTAALTIRDGTQNLLAIEHALGYPGARGTPPIIVFEIPSYPRDLQGSCAQTFYYGKRQYSRTMSSRHTHLTTIPLRRASKYSKVG